MPASDRCHRPSDCLQGPQALHIGLETSADRSDSDQVTCLYISRYAPERSPTDPYMALPWFLSQHTCFIGMWGASRKPDASFYKRCWRVFETPPTCRGWFKTAHDIVGLRNDSVKAGFVICGIDEYSLTLGFFASAVLHLQLFCIVEDPPFTGRYETAHLLFRSMEKWARTALLRLLLPRCRRIFCFIEKEALREYRLPDSRLCQMMNAASSRALHWAQNCARKGNPGSRPIVGFIGAIQPAQGIDMLLEIFSRARMLVPDLRLRLIGPMDARFFPDFQSSLRNLGIGHAVEVTGWLPYEKMLEKMEECYTGVYCNPPSEWYLHAQPLKVCEYLALGKPTVAWDYPGTRRLLDHGRLGLLVSPGDKQAFASALASLADKSKYEEIAAQIDVSLTNEWKSSYWHKKVLESILCSLQ